MNTLYAYKAVYRSNRVAISYIWGVEEQFPAFREIKVCHTCLCADKRMISSHSWNFYIPKNKIICFFSFSLVSDVKNGFIYL